MKFAEGKVMGLLFTLYVTLREHFECVCHIADLQEVSKSMNLERWTNMSNGSIGSTGILNKRKTNKYLTNIYCLYRIIPIN